MAIKEESNPTGLVSSSHTHRQGKGPSVFIIPADYKPGFKSEPCGGKLSTILLPTSLLRDSDLSSLEWGLRSGRFSSSNMLLGLRTTPEPVTSWRAGLLVIPGQSQGLVCRSHFLGVG